MAILETTVKRFIGDSTDAKPRPGQLRPDSDEEVTALDIPPGSSFLEEDTGRIYRWTGMVWAASAELEDRIEANTELTAAVLRELRADREERRTGLPVATSVL